MPKKATAKAALDNQGEANVNAAELAMAQQQSAIEHRLVPVVTIKPTSDNPRSGMTDATLAELALSIQTQGLIEPVVIRPNDDDGDMLAEFVLVVGERRWRGAQLAGLTEIPAIVRWDLDRKAALELTVIENFQRQDLNPIDEARGFRSLQQVAGLTQKQIAERIGSTQPVVANRLRLLELPDEVQEEIQRGNLSLGQALAILRYSKAPYGPEHQRWMAYEVLDKRLTVKEIEHQVPGLRRMEEAELAVPLGRWLHQLPWGDQPCTDCPFNARVQTVEREQWGGDFDFHWCLKPEHAKELRDAWQAARTAEREQALEKAKQAAKVGPVEIDASGPSSGDTAAAAPDVAADTTTAPAGNSEPAVECPGTPFVVGQAIKAEVMDGDKITAARGTITGPGEDKGLVEVTWADGQTTEEAAEYLMSDEPAAPGPWDHLPQINTLPWDSYERIEQSIRPSACSDECACYGLARSPNYDEPIPICTDPARYRQLKSADTRAANKARAAWRSDELFLIRSAVDKLESVGPRELALLAIYLVRQSSMNKTWEQAAARLLPEGTEWPLDPTNTASWRYEKDDVIAAWEAAAALDPVALVQVLLEGILTKEAEDASEAARGSYFDWYSKETQ